jgi:hypothetical protein
MMKASLLIALFTLLSTPLMAQELRQLARSPKALLMGDAFTSIADDDYTLFYNPAVLGQHRGVELYFMNLSLGATNAIKDLDRFDDLPKDAPGMVGRFIGYPAFAQLGVAPGFKMGPFALSYLVQSSTSIVMRNQVYPSLDVDYRYDRGVIMGFGHAFNQSALGSTSFGVSFKMMNREGLKNSFDVFGTKLLGIIDEGVDDINDIKKRLGYSRGRGYGWDLGLLHTLKMPGSELNFALSVLDVGETRFKVQRGDQPLANQEMSVNFGSSFKQSWGPFSHTLSFDLQHLNREVDFGRRVHLGYTASAGLIEGMVGLNQGYLAYGAGLNLWPVKLMAGFYGVELGSKYKQERGGRAMIYLSLLNMDFDL